MSIPKQQAMAKSAAVGNVFREGQVDLLNVTEPNMEPLTFRNPNGQIQELVDEESSKANQVLDDSLLPAP